MINHVSINNGFWIQFKNHLITFGFKGLPEGTHFTIGFDDRSPDVNFHVTKNSIDPKDKPQIKIVVIDKLILEELSPKLIALIFDYLLQPLDIQELRKKYDYDLGYISFETLQNSEEATVVEHSLIERFKVISKFRRKTRIRIEGDIEKELETFATSKHIRQLLLDNTVVLSDESGNNIEGGMILTEDDTIQVIRINDQWFTLRSDIKLFDILSTVLNTRLALHIVWRVKRALIAMQYAKSYSDTEHMNRPIRIVSQSLSK